MRFIASSLATAAMAAGLVLSSAPPASAAGPFCFGLPDEPLAYVCVTVGDPTVPDPTVTWGEPTPIGYVPAVCYGVGCTEEGPVGVSLPWVTGIGVPRFVEVYWGGQDALDPSRLKDLLFTIRDIADNPCLILLWTGLFEDVSCV